MEFKRRHIWVPLCVVVLSLAVVGGFALFSLLSCDDFLYANFMRHGLNYWLERMKWHYQSFNGRVLVHVAAQFILLLRRWFFALVCVSMCFAIPALSLMADGQGRRQALTGTALFASCLLAMPREVLKDGLYWTSAFCNYVLPTAMLCLLLLLGIRISYGRRTAVGYWVLAFLCGATNEQSGAVAVTLTILFALNCLLKRRKCASALLAVLLCASGLSTIFLSPATSHRAESELPHAPGELFRALSEHLSTTSKILSDGWLVPVILAGLFLLTGLEAVRRWRPGFLLSLIPALAAFVLIFYDSAWLLAGLLLTAAVDGIVLLALHRECPAFLTLAAILSAAAILPTGSVAGRTLLPMCFLLLAADSVMFSALAKKHPAAAGAVPAMLLCASLLGIGPMVRGFAFNWQVERKNQEFIRSAKESQLFYCSEYDYDWTSFKPNYAFMEEYLLLNGLNPKANVTLYHNAPRADVVANGENQYTAILEGGSAMFAIRLVEAFGGVITNIDDTWLKLQITLPWCQVTMNTLDSSTAIFTLQDGQTIWADRWNYEDRTWFREEVYTQVFGLRVDYDEARNTYIFTAPVESAH